MSWQPNPTVTINNSDYTGRAIDRVTITRGRNTVYGSPRAGYATLSIIDVTNGGAGFEVGARVEVTVEDTSGDPVTVFAGQLADWTSRIVPAQPEPLVVYNINCVGPLAILNRRNVLFTGRPEETDGERVTAALTAALPVVWEEFSATRTWANMGNVTWETVDPGFDLSRVDPGVYDLVALPAADSGYNALDVASEAGESAKGFLFETPDGFIGYADSDRRAANAQTGFLTIPFHVLDANGLTLSSSLADLTNRIIVEYGTDETVSTQDNFSLARFGLQETTLRTQLANLADAEARADDFLFAHSVPTIEMQRLDVNLRTNLDPTLRDALIVINSNDAVRVPDLPTKLGFGAQGFRGFVEGTRLNLSTYNAELSLLISDEILSFGSVLWGQVPATIDWQDVNATLTWADARRVTI